MAQCMQQTNHDKAKQYGEKIGNYGFKNIYTQELSQWSSGYDSMLPCHSEAKKKKKRRIYIRKEDKKIHTLLRCICGTGFQ